MLLESSLLTSLKAIHIALLSHVSELILLSIGTIIAYCLTCHYIPVAAPKLFDRNLFGIDINKTTPEQRVALRKGKGTKTHAELSKEEKNAFIPESLGIVVGAVYLTVVLLLVIVLGIDVRDFSGPLTTITVMLLLGFVDDVLEIRWRHKILLSAVGSLPLVLSSYDDTFQVVVPKQLLYLFSRWFSNDEGSFSSSAMINRKEKIIIDSTGECYSSGSSQNKSSFWHSSPVYSPFIAGESHYARLSISCRSTTSSPSSSPAQHCLLSLGPIYLLYLALLCIFCTNSINILAGVNGVEVGQSIIIAAASLIYNLVQYRLDERVVDMLYPPATSDALNPSTLVVPLLSMEERARMTTHRLYALLLLMPFIGVSLALWRFNRYPSRVFVGDSYTYFSGTVLAVGAISGLYSKTLLLFFIPQIINFIISLPQLFGIVPCPPHRVPRWNPETKKLENSGNYTILNLILFLFGGKAGMREVTLTRFTLLFQVVCCLMGFAVRFGIASWVYDHVE